MTASAPTLHLYTPGLLDALTPSEVQSVSLPPLPSMARALARGRNEPAEASLTQQLLHAFQLPADTGIAALTHLGDGGHAAGLYWLRADPVHLQADQDRLLLFAGDALGLRTGEVDQLRAIFNEHFGERGWRLETPLPQRWYLGIAEPPRMHAPAVDEVIGRDINHRLPDGEQGALWRAALNEAQMLLHTSPVNAERERRGELPVNSVWFWGGGAPAQPVARVWAGVCSDEALSRGLALHSATPAVLFPDTFARWLEQAAETDYLAVTDRLQRAHLAGDLPQWREAVVALERDWLAPALQALRSGRMEALVWWPGGDSQVRLDRSALRRFWRRGRALPFAATESAPT